MVVLFKLNAEFIDYWTVLICSLLQIQCSHWMFAFEEVQQSESLLSPDNIHLMAKSSIAPPHPYDDSSARLLFISF